MAALTEYTLRRTGLSDDPNDYVFRCDGVEVGRCYLRALAGNEKRWQWTIYIGTRVSRSLEGIPIAGNTDTLDAAKADFRESFDKMIAAGVVNLSDRPQALSLVPVRNLSRTIRSVWLTWAPAQ